LFAVVTSPIIARTLGPSGRGELAAIFAIVGVAPWISEIGLTAFLGRESARRVHPVGNLLGSTVPIAIATALIAVAVAVPVAHLMGRGRPVVVAFIEIGLFMLPVNAVIQLFAGIAGGEQRWNLIMSAKILSSAGIAVAVVALRLLDALTVDSVAIAYVAIGTLSNAPLLAVLRGTRPWHFEASLATEGVAFGVRSWLSTVAGVGNSYLDQVLMAGLVASRQLGFYALAVSIAGASTALVAATAGAIAPRVAAGEPDLTARACRVTLLFVLASGTCIAVSSPFVLPFVWGHAFAPAVPMLVILLAASVFGVATLVIGAGLVAAGNPSATARAQIVALAITVPALIVVLPFAGGIGAAWVSLVAYAASFIITLNAASRQFALPRVMFLVPTRGDLRWLRDRARRKTAYRTS
jgi:O-antigen/teichoic acid export membrane protein